MQRKQVVDLTILARHLFQGGNAQGGNAKAQMAFQLHA